MAEPQADQFPAAYDDSYATDSTRALTPPAMGGVRIPGHRELAQRLPRRAPADIDHRLSAAMARGVDQATPRPVRLRGSAVATTAVTTTIGLGGPAQGFQRIIRRVTAGPLDYAAGSFPTGIVVMLVISSDKLTNVPDSGYEIVSTTTVYPAEGTWGKDELQLQSGEIARLLITGLTTGAVVIAGGQAYDIATHVPEIYSA